jgi:hypothetical protein
MRPTVLVFVGLAVWASLRSPDIPFKSLLLDNGASETAAVADVNKDGKLDVISGENWYQAPARTAPGQESPWTKHKFRDLDFTNNYYDNFSDLPVDVDADGYPDLVRVTWFAKKISWWKNLGRERLRPERGAGGQRRGAAPPSESERGWGPASSKKKDKGQGKLEPRSAAC